MTTLATVCAECEKIIQGGDWNRVSHGLCEVCFFIKMSELHESTIQEVNQP